MYTNQAKTLLNRSKSSDKLIMCATGHRPPKLGLSYSMEDFKKLTKFVQDICLPCISFDVMISGAAMGFDLAVAQACINENKQVVLAIPFKSFNNNWSIDWINLLENIKSSCYITYVCEDGYNSQKLFERNKFMVDCSKEILALYDDENNEKSGTKHAVNYSHLKGKKIVNVWRLWKDKLTTI